MAQVTSYSNGDNMGGGGPYGAGGSCSAEYAYCY